MIQNKFEGIESIRTVIIKDQMDELAVNEFLKEGYEILFGKVDTLTSYKIIDVGNSQRVQSISRFGCMLVLGKKQMGEQNGEM